MFSPIILVFQPEQAGAKSDCRNRQLQAHGFEVVLCSHLLELYRNVQANLAQAGNRVLVLLSGKQPDNCLAASYLRALHPAIGILALATENNETACLRLMQSGADNYCRRDASFELLLAIILRALGRMGADVFPPVAPTMPIDSGEPVQQQGYWQLQERGWVLAGPQGQHISLTTGERAFMTALLLQPDLRAEYKLLIAAVNSSYALASVATQRVRLNLLVSRLRRKLRAHGVTDFPLKSLHNWGYMFTGRVL